MIRGFRHKGLKRFFAEPRYSDGRGVNADTQARLVVILDALDVIKRPEEMNIAGLFFHRLKGPRAAQYSVRVYRNRRVTWRMDGEDVVDVNLEDYH